MTTIWTTPAKPSSTTWTNSYVPTAEIYDDENVTYDSASMAYDGSSITWTNTTIGASAAVGLYEGFGAFTYSGGQRLSTSWTDVAKPT